MNKRAALQDHKEAIRNAVNMINRALDPLGVIKLLHVGDSRPGGNASEFSYVLPL